MPAVVILAMFGAVCVLIIAAGVRAKRKEKKEEERVRVQQDPRKAA